MVLLRIVLMLASGAHFRNDLIFDWELFSPVSSRRVSKD